MTPEQLAKLPKWAQEEFGKLARERDAAVRALQEWQDDQTPSAFFVSEWVCDGAAGRGPTRRTRFVQGRRMECDHAGIHLSIMLREDTIELQYAQKDRGTGPVNLTPYSYQALRLSPVDR